MVSGDHVTSSVVEAFKICHVTLPGQWLFVSSIRRSPTFLECVLTAALHLQAWHWYSSCHQAPNVLWLLQWKKIIQWSVRSHTFMYKPMSQYIRIKTVQFLFLYINGLILIIKLWSLKFFKNCIIIISLRVICRGLVARFPWLLSFISSCSTIPFRHSDLQTTLSLMYEHSPCYHRCQPSTTPPHSLWSTLICTSWPSCIELNKLS